MYACPRFTTPQPQLHTVRTAGAPLLDDDPDLDDSDDEEDDEADDDEGDEDEGDDDEGDDDRSVREPIAPRRILFPAVNGCDL